MTYQLAKQLKDAGFPQSLKDDGSNVFMGEGNPMDPNLSELIEACSIKFDALIKRNDVWEAGLLNPVVKRWLYYSKGSTPEEAVANLWLDLVTASEDGDRESRAFLATFAPFAAEVLREHAN